MNRHPRWEQRSRIGGASQNKELERTRSTQTAVGPRRSIQCWTGLTGCASVPVSIERRTNQ